MLTAFILQIMKGEDLQNLALSIRENAVDIANRPWFEVIPQLHDGARYPSGSGSVRLSSPTLRTARLKTSIEKSWIDWNGGIAGVSLSKWGQGTRNPARRCCQEPSRSRGLFACWLNKKFQKEDAICVLLSDGKVFVVNDNSLSKRLSMDRGPARKPWVRWQQ